MINIKANIVDLRRDTPRADDNFFVDTNVWYWVCYTTASYSAKNYQIKEYPNYLSKAIAANSQLHLATLSFAELAHIIERNEREIYNLANGTNVTTKDFRHDYPAERLNITTEIETVWRVARHMANNRISEIDITDDMVKSAIVQLHSDQLDGYDLFIAEALRSQQIEQLITDDMDFGTVASITVFTASNTLINAAKAQGKLVKR